MKRLLLLVLFNILLIVPRPAAADQVLIWQRGQYGAFGLTHQQVNVLGQVAFVTISYVQGTQFDTLWITPPADTGSVAGQQLFQAGHDIDFIWMSIDGIVLNDQGVLTVTALHNSCPGSTHYECLAQRVIDEEVFVLDTQPGSGHATGTFQLQTVIDEALYRISLVPEPSTWLLLGSGLVGLAFARKVAAHEGDRP